MSRKCYLISFELTNECISITKCPPFKQKDLERTLMSDFPSLFVF